MIQDIVLSPVAIFIVFGVLLLLVTNYAFREREIQGYILGWLIAIFFIIAYQSLTGDSPDADAVDQAVDADDDDTLSFVAVMIPSAIGMILGVGVRFVAATITRTHARRSATVAISTALIVIFMFLLTVVSDSTAQILGLFILAAAIGNLSTRVFGTGSVGGGRGGGGNGDGGIDFEERRRRYGDDFKAQDASRDIPSADIDRARSDFDRFRRRDDR